MSYVVDGAGGREQVGDVDRRPPGAWIIEYAIEALWRVANFAPAVGVPITAADFEHASFLKAVGG